MPEKIPNGFILLSRELLRSKLWSCSDATFRVAVYLLLRVNYEPNYFKRIPVLRGQTAVSISTIANDCGISIKSVRHALKILEEDAFISKDSPFGAQQGQRITVLKYDTYQTIKNYKGTVGAHEGNDEGYDEGNDELPPIKEVKKERSKEEGEAQAPAPPFPKPKSFKQYTEEDFSDDVFLIEIAMSYDKSMVEEFISYWTEPSPSGKMKFQLQKTWETKRRLAKWASNNFSNKPSGSGSNRPIQVIQEMPTEEQYLAQENVDLDENGIPVF